MSDVLSSLEEYSPLPPGQEFVCRAMSANDRIRLWNELNNHIQKSSCSQLFPFDWLPETGVAVFDSRNILIAGIFVYFEKSSPVAVAGWCVTKCGLPSAVSYRAVKELLSALPDYARSSGASHLLTTFGNRAVNRMLDRAGFLPGDSGVEHRYMKL